MQPILKPNPAEPQTVSHATACEGRREGDRSLGDTSGQHTNPTKPLPFLTNFAKPRPFLCRTSDRFSCRLKSCQTVNQHAGKRERPSARRGWCSRVSGPRTSTVSHKSVSNPAEHKSCRTSTFSRRSVCALQKEGETGRLERMVFWCFGSSTPIFFSSSASSSLQPWATVAGLALAALIQQAPSNLPTFLVSRWLLRRYATFRGERSRTPTAHQGVPICVGSSASRSLQQDTRGTHLV